MTYSKAMELGVGLMDNSISEWARKHPDCLHKHPVVEHVQVEDGVYHGRIYLSDTFFIFVFGESWEEVELKGKLRWSKITGKPVGL